MRSMIPWDKLEAVLLLDAIFDIQSNKITRSEAVKKVSKLLRERAVKEGLQIDDKFRNTNGISFQMLHMENALNSYGKDSSGNKLFDSVIALYFNNKYEYNKLLQESRIMIVGTGNYKDDFFNYVVLRKAGVASEIFIAMEAMDSYAVSKGLLDNSMFTFLDFKKIESIQNMVDKDKEFRKLNGKSLIFSKIGMSLLREYVSKNGFPVNVSAKEFAGVDRYNEKIGEQEHFTDESFEKTEISLEENEKLVDFSCEENYSYTNPVYLYCKHDKISNLKNWTDLYIKFVRYLWQNYSQLLAPYIGRNWGRGTRADLSDTDEGMIAPKKVVDNLYLETNLNAHDILKKLRLVFAICGIEIDEVSIVYTQKSKEQSASKCETTSRYNSIEEKFIKWMVDNRGLANNTARSYLSTIRTCDLYANKNGLYTDSIVSRTSIDAFNSLYNMLVNDDNFKSLNEKRFNNCIAALNVCREFIVACGNMENESDDNISDSGVSDELVQQINNVLRENFEDGYQPGNYLHQMRFASHYEETFGVAFPKDADEQDRILKKFGRVVEDRVYSNDITQHTELFDTIFIDVQEAFSNGATVVYLTSVFERFRKRLFDINIYNCDALRAIIADNSKFLGCYQVRKNALLTPGTDPDIAMEVERYLRSSHIPLTYDDFMEKLWYIPLDKVKIELVRNPNAVNVDNGTYFYAPNFDISNDEMSKLVKAMNEQIYTNGYIVTARLRELYRANCPLSAMDSESFKDYGIREIFKALLSDKFDFSSSVIAEKGGSLDIGGVFQNFAAERESLTIDQIKEFAADLQIDAVYWSSIMKEMVRVSNVLFVSKDKVHFDTEAIDNVLETMCLGDYTALKEINLFLSFPDIGYKWNGFVLESYLRSYSKKFKLFQLSISNDDYNGIMVKTSSKFTNYDDVAADMLAHCFDWNDEKSALVCLVNSGFQQRAMNKNIAAIIKSAKIIRENIT